MPQPRRTWLVCAALIAVTLAAYAPVYKAGFIDLDDPIFVAENPHVLEGLTPANVAWAFTTTRGGYWHPLTWLSLQLDATLFAPTSPSPFHVMNVLWHTGNVLMVFAALLRLSGSFWRSALVAALFALHPLHVESVAWVTERKDVLSVFFGLASLWAYASYGRGMLMRWYVLALLLFVLSLMAKSMLVTLPCVFLLVDAWPLGRVLGWRVFLEKVPFVMAAAVFSALTIRSFPLHYSLDFLPLRVRLANALSAYLGYLEKTFVPVDLALYYPFPLQGPALARVVLAGAVLAGISALLIRYRPYLLVGWFWFLGTLVPVIGLFQAGLPLEMADRFAYFPHIGLFLTLVWGTADLRVRQRLPSGAAAATTFAVLASLFCLTVVQCSYWTDSKTLTEHMLEVTRENFLANRLLGVYYLSRQDMDKAEGYLREALRIHADDIPANLGLAQVLAGRGQVSAALPYYRHVLALNYVSPSQRGRAQYFLGMHLLQLGKTEQGRTLLREYLKNPMLTPEMDYFAGVALLELGDRREAMSRWEKVLNARPNYPEANFQYGRMLLVDGKAELALAHLTRAAAGPEHPGLAMVYDLRGLALGRLGHWTEAIASIEKAVRLEPGFVSAQADLAYARERAGDHAAADKDYKQILKMSPDWPEQASQQVLHRLAKSGPEHDPLRALELATEACQASGFQNPRCLEALAMAYAANSRFPDALQTARQAIVLSTDAALRQRLEEQLRSWHYQGN